jgi:hypothetical protein
MHHLLKPKSKTGVFLLFFLFPLLLLAGLLYVVAFFFTYLYNLSRYIWWQKWSKPKRIGAITTLWGIVVGGLLLVSANQPKTLGATTTAQPEQEGNCVGPDGKRLWLSEEKCRAFNDAWKNPQPNHLPQAAQAVQPPTNTPIPNTPVPTDTLVPVKKTYPTAVYLPPTATPTVAAPPAQNNTSN